jgi:hypothetical protein
MVQRPSLRVFVESPLDNAAKSLHALKRPVQMEEVATDSAWAFHSGENLGTEVIKAVCRFTQTS